jgi:DNA-binding MarR family transcriptional regulator
LLESFPSDTFAAGARAPSMVTTDKQSGDWIDEVYEAWDREFPTTRHDTASLKTITRLARLGVLLNDFQQDTLDPLGLVMSDFMVMAALRRLGPPYQARPSELYNVLERSSGGMTKMVKRLERLELIERIADPNDGRASLVGLTRRGVNVHAEAFGAFLGASRDLMDDLPKTRVQAIDAALQSLVGAFERYFYRS